MARPRMVLPGKVKMCTRRCSERRFFLRPDRETVQALLYCLGYCMEKWGVTLHELVVLSNHLHFLYTDHEDAPEFFRDFFSLTARAINARWGRWESLWDPVPYHDLRILEPGDVVAKAAYVLTNPVEAGLVRFSDEWGGPTSWSLEYGQSIVVERPDFFFREQMPKQVTIRLTRPPIFPELSDAEVRAKVRQATRERQRELIRKIRSGGGSFLGMHRVMNQARHQSPLGREPRRGIRPTVAGRSRWARGWALEEQRRFWRRHREASVSWCGGDRGVVFPYGTYLMKRRYRVQVEEPPGAVPAAN